MPNISFLEFKFKLSKNRFLRKPSRMFSRERQQNSTPSLGTFQPNVGEMRQIFDKFDSNKDGKISQTEYKATLKALGQEKAMLSVPKIFQAVDLDGDGFIDFKEFQEAHKRSGWVKQSDIQSAFRTFDLNGDGKISAEEVMEVLKRLGEKFSLGDCRKMVKGVDADGDGLVNMDEFMSMMTRSMNIGRSM